MASPGFIPSLRKMFIRDSTGLTMQGRRWSDGLHQAVEAKEGVEIQNENQTLASITFQNYFRLYEKLAGMTGTADTEAFEFSSISVSYTHLGGSHQQTEFTDVIRPGRQRERSAARVS